MAKMYKVKNKADHYNHINFKGKYMYDFDAGEIKEVCEEVIPYIDKEKFEIIKNSKETAEKKIKKTTRKTLFRRKKK